MVNNESDGVHRFDEVRARSGELENHVIDELAAGRLSRRDFVLRASVAGLSASAVGVVLAACGGANQTPSEASSSQGAGSSAPAKRGGTLRLAQQVPSGAINPLTVSDAGGLNILGQSGEYLILNNNGTLRLEPQLATSWSSNHEATVWTFRLRPGVKFNNGQTMTADDVTWTFRELSDSKNASNALSNFSGVLEPAGVRKVDAHTIAFHLQSPNGNFPYLVSSDNYNAIIVPKGTNWETWHKTFVGTGPWRIKQYQQNVSASFTANHTYWGPKPLLDGTVFTFYDGQPSQLVALQGGQVDGVVGIVAQGAQGVLSGAYAIVTRKSSGHREISMRCDQAPFTDARVRRALALTVDRVGLVKAVLSGYAELGNDSPFAPRFASTDRSVPQRTQDIAEAKRLLAAAGHPRGLHATYTSERIIEMPALAQVVQTDARKAGIDLSLNIEEQSTYYGKATFGDSDWLDATISAVDYGDRGAPNTFLQAPLVSHGVWNAAHFSDPTYDRLVRQYVGTVDLQGQRRIAGVIERLLLEQTPLIIPYFIDGLTVTTKNVRGTNPSSNGAIFLGGASLA